MRVIAGKARRLQLKTIEGMDTRPTTDRIKETLFNMINNDIADAIFLDLFSGSGAIGIEALSRDAKKVYFVENNRKAVNCIKNNLKFTKLEDDAIVLMGDAISAMSELKSDNITFDVIFMDPPYNKLLEKEVLTFLAKTDLINENTLIIIEASLETDFSYAADLGYEIIKEKTYKTNKHIFVKMDGE